MRWLGGGRWRAALCGRDIEVKVQHERTGTVPVDLPALVEAVLEPDASEAQRAIDLLRQREVALYSTHHCASVASVALNRTSRNSTASFRWHNPRLSMVSSASRVSGRPKFPSSEHLPRGCPGGES